MGAITMFEENIPLHSSLNLNGICSLELLDNNGVPEIRINFLDHNNIRMSFDDWSQYERFIDAAGSIHERLRKIK